jgi:isoleucyl-tRNA synthetase
VAPAYGEDDAALGRAHEIVGPSPVQDDGTFDATVPDYAGRYVFDANREIVSRLKHEGAVLRDEQYTHSYPHCWRCDSPLLYRAVTTWFVRVTAVKEQLLAANQKIRWVPEHIRDGRFGNWLENARDWAVSRSRFWGAPVPVWRCESCSLDTVIGSRQELQDKSGVAVTDWHRPAIDEIAWRCVCGGTTRRVSDVLDCWFESGSMPYGQNHYPFEHRAEFEASFPGDFIVEYIAQTRGWFYTLVVLSAAIFNERPFKNVVCHGVILAADGRKMSKRLKNYPDPLELVETHGSDALRIALMQSVAVRGVDMRFSGEAATYDAVRRFCIPLWNCLHFFTSYAAIERFEPTGLMPAPTRLDRYLLSETDRLRQSIEDAMAAYDIAGCYDAIEDYVVTLSTWYIRLSRGRLWSAERSADQITCFEVLYAALSNLTRIAAPFLPFLAERFFEALGSEGSVHLQDWPAARPDWRDHDLSVEMANLRTVIRLARSIRETHRISHRQPLRSAAIANLADETIERNRDILLEELNVKEIGTLEPLDNYVQSVVKLNYRVLGKRLRGDMSRVAAAIAAGQYTLGEDQTTLFVLDHELRDGDFTLQYEPTASQTAVAAEGRLVVVIDLTIDAELEIERRVRDLNRLLQDLRKEAGLEYQDRIVVGIVGPPAIRDAVSQHETWLAEQTLAIDIRYAPLPAPMARKDVTIDKDYPAEIMIARPD